MWCFGPPGFELTNKSVTVQWPWFLPLHYRSHDEEYPGFCSSNVPTLALSLVGYLTVFTCTLLVMDYNSCSLAMHSLLCHEYSIINCLFVHFSLVSLFCSGFHILPLLYRLAFKWIRVFPIHLLSRKPGQLGTVPPLGWIWPKFALSLCYVIDPLPVYTRLPATSVPLEFQPNWLTHSWPLVYSEWAGVGRYLPASGTCYWENQAICASSLRANATVQPGVYQLKTCRAHEVVPSWTLGALGHTRSSSSSTR